MNIKTASMNSVVIALAFGFTLAGANIARADSAPETRSIKVSLAGLDLSTPDGAGEARARVHEAARAVCGRVEDPNNLAPHFDFMSCLERTEKSALQQIKGPTVLASK